MNTPRMSAEHTPGPWGIDDPLSPARHEEAEANARLIAAAPDLLAACKALLDVSLQGGAQARYQARADAIEAIAKAEGRKPDFLTDSERALIAARDEFRKK